MAKTVIHVSHVKLPDPRIERIACLEKKYLGHSPIIYIGGGSGACFDDIINYPGEVESIGYSERKKAAEFINSVIKEYKPDYIHVHDIFAAYPVLELGVNFIYDDHELHYIKNKDLLLSYISIYGIRRYFRLYGPPRYIRSVLEKLYKYIATRFFTKKIAKSASAIVAVSPTMKRIYEEVFGAEKVFVVPNFPIREELPDAETILRGLDRRVDIHPLRLVYTTGNFHSDYLGVTPYRDVGEVMRMLADASDVVIDVYSRDSDPSILGELAGSIRMKGYVPRAQLVAKLVEYHGGLVPFRPSLTHTIGGSNKAVEYLHAGLPVILPSSYTGMLMLLKEFNELIYTYNRVSRDIFAAILNNLREFYIGGGAEIIKKMLPRIRNRLVMENYAEELRKAYTS